jgi:hypothetical protein
MEVPGGSIDESVMSLKQRIESVADLSPVNHVGLTAFFLADQAQNQSLNWALRQMSRLEILGFFRRLYWCWSEQTEATWRELGECFTLVSADTFQHSRLEPPVCRGSKLFISVLGSGFPVVENSATQFFCILEFEEAKLAEYIEDELTDAS